MNHEKEEYTMENVILNNKLECPVVGIGTFMLSPADAENSVREALKMGYRLIDTANAYVNERAVGRGMRDSGVKREEIFLQNSGQVNMRILMRWMRLWNVWAWTTWISFIYISLQETGLQDTDSLRRPIRKARQRALAFPILKESISKNWRLSGRLRLSSSR